MAQYKAMEGFDKMDQKELTGYLYQLNEQLRYMFDNLTPEDNYSNQALTKYLEDEKRVASLKFDLDGLKVEVSDFEKNTNAKFEATDSKIDMKVSKGTVSSEISLESGQVTISGNRLVVNSTNFKLDASGNATFSGTVKGATITGSHIRCKGGAFEADEDAVYIGGFYTFDTSRGQYLGTGDPSTRMGDNGLYCLCSSGCRAGCGCHSGCGVVRWCCISQFLRFGRCAIGRLSTALQHSEEFRVLAC